MAARGTIQAPGMMRHGPFPSLGPAVHHPLDALPPPELLENKIAVQGAELETLARENQRLAATHVTLRQDLVITQQEMQRLHSHVGKEKMESDIQMRGLLEKIAKLEADLQAGDIVRKELQQAHLEAQSLVAVRQDLTSQIQQGTDEMQKALADIKRIPELHAELDGLRLEHQKLRAAFEYEKGSNVEQVKQMHVMEKNLISMAREVEKLRADVLNAEKRTHVAAAPSTYEGSYGAGDSSQHQSGTQSANYASSAYNQAAGGYMQTAGYSNPSYPDAYGRAPPVHSGGMTADGASSYGGVYNYGSYNPPRGALSSAYGNEQNPH